MDKLDVILWMLGVSGGFISIIASAIWVEVKGVSKKVSRLGEKNAAFEVRLTSLERSSRCAFTAIHQTK